MSTSVPRNFVEFDPVDQQDPERGLTLAIRGLRMGEAIRMPKGTVVRSATVQRGGSQERRFAVIPSEESSTPEERHKAYVLGHSTYRRADEAAKKALERE